jgi:hypothetical protein
MGKGKADSDKQGRFARWRERRKRNKLRAIENRNRTYEDRARQEGRASQNLPHIP